MPRIGTRDLTPLRDSAPTVTALSLEPLDLPNFDLLQLMFEIDDGQLLQLLPRNVQPTIPPTATVVVWNCPEGPLGPFLLAQVRVSCRAGVRSRGYLLAAYCSSETAAAGLRNGWGFNCRPGAITFARRYDAVTATVASEGRTILAASSIDPTIVPPTDFEWSGNLNLARMRDDSGERLRLVQAEPEYALDRTERGHVRLEQFDAAAWSAEGLEPSTPIAAVDGHGNLRLAPVRYLVDPELPLLQGTERFPSNTA